MIDLLAQTLREAGHSLTKPRMTVFGALQAPKPKTMNQLVTSVSDIINRASVYRAVALFEELGIITRIQHGWKYRLELSDAFTPHHHHLTCNKCHRIISFDEPDRFDEIVSGIAASHGFVLQNHGLEVYGLCPECQTKKAAT
ncbi:transcriptional repressor [Candidatus Saccharibacteria bacterium]|nr:transcriptional repressor [Candidatus Saccharibacteria bacterium]